MKNRSSIPARLFFDMGATLFLSFVAWACQIFFLYCFLSGPGWIQDPLTYPTGRLQIHFLEFKGKPFYWFCMKNKHSCFLTNQNVLKYFWNLKIKQQPNTVSSFCLKARRYTLKKLKFILYLQIQIIVIVYNEIFWHW